MKIPIIRAIRLRAFTVADRNSNGDFYSVIARRPESDAWHTHWGIKWNRLYSFFVTHTVTTRTFDPEISTTLTSSNMPVAHRNPSWMILAACDPADSSPLSTME